LHIQHYPNKEKLYTKTNLILHGRSKCICWISSIFEKPKKFSSKRGKKSQTKLGDAENLLEYKNVGDVVDDDNLTIIDSNKKFQEQVIM